MQCFSGSGLQDELALLVHQHGHLSVCRRCRSVPAIAAAASLRHFVSHMTHLNTEGKLVT